MTVVAGAPMVTVEEGKNMLDRDGYKMLDVRPFKAYDREHLTKPPQCTTNVALAPGTLPDAKFVAAVEAQLRSGPLEVNIAGDFDPAEMDEMIVKFLGTAAPGGALTPQIDVEPLPLNPLTLKEVPAKDEQRAQRLWLRDSDERACAVRILIDG